MCVIGRRLFISALGFDWSLSRPIKILLVRILKKINGGLHLICLRTDRLKKRYCKANVFMN